EATCAVKDILNETDIPQFDYIFCSGIFNIRIEDIKTHLEYVRLMLARMYDLIHCGIAVNFLSEGAIPVSDQEDLNSGRYFFFNPEKILGFCRELGCRYVLRHDYHPGDFTVFMLK
ncbi:MAG: hypothetical protein KJ811_00585, partial [Candidatus Margulisbacteria bacterium]|nr:hypothetical protein [Candidatus Margulisiibacteriota bacterium]